MAASASVVALLALRRRPPPPSPSSPPSKAEDNSVVIAVGAACGGVAFLLAVIAIIVFLVMRRSSTSSAVPKEVSIHTSNIRALDRRGPQRRKVYPRSLRHAASSITTIDVPLGGTISRYAPTGFYSGMLHVLASALVTYFTAINCDFKQHFRTGLHVTVYVFTSRGHARTVLHGYIYRYELFRSFV